MDNVIDCSWDEFKQQASDHIKNNLGPRMCRGQANPAWTLATSFHRNPNGLSLPNYFLIVDQLADVIGTLENREIDVRNAEVNASFLAYLQHHGFPTPLLDWSLSPYVAAYFAFSEILQSDDNSKSVSIYIFDFLKWMLKWKPVFDYTVTAPHVSVLKPKSLGNKRQISQQGFYYTFTNQTNIEDHIRRHESASNETYLQIFRIPYKEKFYAMTELEMMGITAYSLFGTSDSLCRHYKESVFRKDNEGKSPLDRMVELLKAPEKSD